MKISRLIPIIALFLLFAVELILRFCFGFCDTVLMVEDQNYEYIAQANQSRYRFRNQINYNSLSMRSSAVDSSSIKILGFGDSVINGGVQTDHNSLATTILSDTLSKIKQKNIQFLNISAGSWGPDNCFAYLKKHGHFKAKAIFLFVSSHDAYDNMQFEKKIVGINKSFPNSQYSLALVELFDRYLFPILLKKVKVNEKISESQLGINKKTTTTTFNSGFKSFLDYSKDNKIPLIIYLHADKNELKAVKYNKQGQKIIEFSKKNEIKIILDLEAGLNATEFRDQIHLNDKGQQKMMERILNSNSPYSLSQNLNSSILDII
jgi:lysophospholipase L1-like esterase